MHQVAYTLIARYKGKIYKLVRRLNRVVDNTILKIIEIGISLVWLTRAWSKSSRQIKPNTLCF